MVGNLLFQWGNETKQRWGSCLRSHREDNWDVVSHHPSSGLFLFLPQVWFLLLALQLIWRREGLLEWRDERKKRYFIKQCQEIIWEEEKEDRWKDSSCLLLQRRNLFVALRLLPGFMIQLSG